jgi:hypothetical protein
VDSPVAEAEEEALAALVAEALAAEVLVGAGSSWLVAGSS